MRCPACRCESPEGARFCSECGTVLRARCAGCGAELTPAAKFCSECGQRVAEPVGRSGAPGAGPAVGPTVKDPRTYTPKHLAEKILAQRSALEGERKPLTVLFADVRGSLELAAALDPKAWHQLLERFFEILAEGIHRYEGTINQYTGDA